MRLSKVVVSFVHDAIVACMTVSLALYLRLGDEAFALPPADVALMTVSFLAISATAFTFFGVYRGVWRYASLGDLMVIIKATTVAVLLFIACMYLFKQLDSIPRSVPVIQWFLLVVVLGGSRFSYRLFRHQHQALAPRDQPAAPIPVLLVGACEGAEQFIRSTKADVNAPYKVVGVVDDHAEFQGRFIHGVPVLGQCDELTAVLARLASRGVRPQRLIMADATGKRNDAATQEMLRTAERLGLTAACLPRLTDFRDTPKDGEIDLQPIALEDLLGRPQAPLDRDAISRLIAGRRVLITGAGGTIGSELARQIAALRPAELTLLDFSEFNLYSIDIELRERHPVAALPRGAVQHPRPRAGHAAVRRASAGAGVPRRRAQARADGRAEQGRGRADQRARHPQRRRCRQPLRRPRHGPGVDRQGGQSDQRDGRQQAARRVLLPGARRRDQSRSGSRAAHAPVHDRALRQRARLERLAWCRCSSASWRAAAR